MPHARLYKPSGEDMRRCILNQLGETADGLTQGQLLACYTRCRLPDEISLKEVGQFIDELAAMRAGGRTTVWRSDTIVLVHQQSPHGWLAWVRGKQEEEARGGRTLAWVTA